MQNPLSQRDAGIHHNIHSYRKWVGFSNEGLNNLNNYLSSVFLQGQ